MIEIKAKVDCDTLTLRDLIDEAVGNRIWSIAGTIAKEAKDSMVLAPNAPKGPPSRPGTPPHRETGDLANSIRRRRRVRRVVVVAEKFYGEIHEFGGRYHPKRPFLAPAARKVLRRLGKTALADLRLASTPQGKRLNAKRKS